MASGFLWSPDSCATGLASAGRGPLCSLNPHQCSPPVQCCDTAGRSQGQQVPRWTVLCLPHSPCPGCGAYGMPTRTSACLLRLAHSSMGEGPVWRSGRGPVFSRSGFLSMPSELRGFSSNSCPHVCTYLPCLCLNHHHVSMRASGHGVVGLPTCRGAEQKGPARKGR